MGKQRRRPQTSQMDCADWAAGRSYRAEFPSTLRSYDLHRGRHIFSTILRNDVIPRLLEQYPRSSELTTKASDANSRDLSQHVDAFSELIIHADATEARAFFDKLIRTGVTPETLFQNLLAPTARRLGELWDEDINDFMDVTRGVGHLQELVRSLGDSQQSDATSAARSEALFMTLPGEQHTLGLAMLREDFLRAGWHVWCGPAKNYKDIIETVAGRSFDLVGLSANLGFSAQELKTAIAMLRKASRNKAIKVIVGGGEFERRPELVAAIGAEGTARNGTQALRAFAGLSLK